MKCEKWTDQHDMSLGQRKIWVPDRNWTHDLLNTGGALSTELHWSTHLSHFITELKIHHLYSVIINEHSLSGHNNNIKLPVDSSFQTLTLLVRICQLPNPNTDHCLFQVWSKWSCFDAQTCPVCLSDTTILWSYCSS